MTTHLAFEGPCVPEAELSDLEARVETALARGDAAGLEILGYGEISIVLGLRGATGRYACKRLPPVATAEDPATAFAEADAWEARTLTALQRLSPPDRRPWWIRRTWQVRNRRAGVPG